MSIQRILVSENAIGDELTFTLKPTKMLVSELGCLKENHFSQFTGEFTTAELLTNHFFLALSKLLVADAEALLRVQQLDESDLNSLQKGLLVAGFTLQGKQSDGSHHNITLKKKSFKSVALKGKEGASAQVQTEDLSKLTPNVGTGIEQTQPQSLVGQYQAQGQKKNPFAAVKLGATEMIDEDALLDENETYQKFGVEAEDCSTKPKACKNCSCGRKELEETQEKDDLIKNIENNNVSSSCGSCYLGDAFRCASCPYKGLPAFKPGEKVKLDLQNDAGMAVEENQANVKNGKVLISID
eukprot:TRINITY_DN1392_c0_g1_i7.p1 TRINITY_DN1392_c0_g1~~TRINITY_DN1392_c0_g1_i7.p1  ORF type:complete len:298 (+),score=41.45 TRINITY_DN1392_c0_g1_i7:50-943(+)